jgi:hypothetical protein
MDRRPKVFPIQKSCISSVDPICMSQSPFLFEAGLNDNPASLPMGREKSFCEVF